MGTTRFRIALALLLVSGTAFAQQQSSPGIRLLVERVQERLDETTDLRARFVQHRLSRLGSITQTASGRLYMQTPGKMRWEYEQDDQLLVTGGLGREMYHFFPDDNQVQVYQSEQMSGSDIPILYLTGRGSLRRDFNIEHVEWGPTLSPGNVQLELQPQRGGASFERLILEVEPMQATIVRLVKFDNLRNTIDYQFQDVEFDVGLDDALFEFEIPDGADVIFVGS